MRTLLRLQHEFNKIALRMKWLLRLSGLTAALAILSSGQLLAQTTFRVFFKDKGPEAFEPGSTLYQKTSQLFTQRALDRRRKVLGDNELLSLSDAPVYQPYIDSIVAAHAHAKALVTLRWNNYAIIQADSADSASLASLPFVRAVRPTSSRLGILASQQSAPLSTVFSTEHTASCGAFRYGPSYEQAASINAPAVHRLGITGHNVLMGFLDSGFRWRTQPTIAHANVVAEYDFIFADSVTANQQPDIPSQDDHGTLVLSTVAGFSQDSLVGIAPHAQFMLGKTEDIRSERHIEEDNYAAGVEWMESQGVDIITSSLGYYDFDDDQEDYLYEQLDGSSTIVAQAVNRAVGLGVVCITAAGNEGAAPKPGNLGTIISPGDADSVITVAAAVRNQQAVASFSSRGPIGNGKRKPDIAAQGVMVFCADADNIPVVKTSDGTSLATPLIAGGTALIMSVFPELRPWEVRELLFSTASQANAPDTALGYGLADIFKAISSHGIAIAPSVAVLHPEYRRPELVRIVVKMLSSTLSLSGTLHIRFSGTTAFSQYPLHASAVPYTYFADIPLSEFQGHVATAYVEASNGLQTRRMPFYNDSLLTIDPSAPSIPCGLAQTDLPYEVSGNIIEGVHPSVARRQETDVVTVALATEVEAEINVQVYNILGQQMAAYTIPQASAGLTTITLPISSLAVGTYFVQVVYNGSVQSLPFTVVP